MTVSEMHANDALIFAPATPAGQSGVAVYRVSGKNLSPLLAHLGLPTSLPARKATLCQLQDRQAECVLDQALAIYFPAPHSFTGEEVLELHTHGGSAIRQSLMDCLARLDGCRLAEPGEFSKRAFYNNKMDLLQAEGIADLIAAETAMQQQQALRQLNGQLSDTFSVLRGDALRSLALLEAYLDFPDEEIPEETLQEIRSLISRLQSSVNAMLNEPPCGEIIRDGLSVAIIGPPNAGKSSLMNRLAGREVAIVSDIAGTTRDRIEVQLNLDGYLIRLIDTAGLREAADSIEAEGIRRAQDAAANADLTLVVFDVVSDAKQFKLPDEINPNRCVILWNKCDQLTDIQHTETTYQGIATLSVSAMSGDGIDRLLEHLSSYIAEQIQSRPSPIITRARHRQALIEAADHLQRFDLHLPLELCAEELRCAARAIGKITGHIEVDQLLDVIFREFCIGK